MDAPDEFDVLTMLAIGGIAKDPEAAIDMINRRHQAEACETTTLPSNGDRAAWEQLGVIFGEKADELFVHAALPAGWSKKPTDHPMHTSIVDGAGNVRGSYFYKGALYDRDAILYAPLCRYRIAKDFDAYQSDRARGINAEHTIVTDRVTGDELFRTHGKIGPDGDRREWPREAWDEMDALISAVREKATTWLHETHPDWRDPGAYWTA